MFTWLLGASHVLALALQDIIPPQARGVVTLTPDTLVRAKAGQRVHLVLPEPSVLQHRLDLPSQGHSINPAWLSARVEALSPWELNACLWDARLVSNQLELAIIHLAPVAKADSFLILQGARLVEVSAKCFWFRRDAVQLRRWRGRLVLMMGLVTVLALGLAGFGVQAFLQAQDRAEWSLSALERSAARLKEGAGPAQAALALLQRKSGSVSLALSHLAEALPKDSYLTNLFVTSEGLEIVGQTLTPERIIPSLSTDPIFATVNFAGPAVRDPDTNTYSFSIQATLGVLP